MSAQRPPTHRRVWGRGSWHTAWAAVAVAGALLAIGVVIARFPWQFTDFCLAAVPVGFLIHWWRRPATHTFVIAWGLLTIGWAIHTRTMISASLFAGCMAVSWFAYAITCSAPAVAKPTRAATIKLVVSWCGYVTACAVGIAIVWLISSISLPAADYLPAAAAGLVTLVVLIVGWRFAVTQDESPVQRRKPSALPQNQGGFRVGSDVGFGADRYAGEKRQRQRSGHAR